MAIKSSFMRPQFIAINELESVGSISLFIKQLISTNISKTSLDYSECFPGYKTTVVPVQQFLPGINSQETASYLSFPSLIPFCAVLHLLFFLFCRCHGINGIFLHGHFLMTLLNNPEVDDLLTNFLRREPQRNGKEAESLSESHYI